MFDTGDHDGTVGADGTSLITGTTDRDGGTGVGATTSLGTSGAGGRGPAGWGVGTTTGASHSPHWSFTPLSLKATSTASASFTGVPDGAGVGATTSLGISGAGREGWGVGAIGALDGGDGLFGAISTAELGNIRCA